MWNTGGDDDDDEDDGDDEEDDDDNDDDNNDDDDYDDYDDDDDAFLQFLLYKWTRSRNTAADWDTGPSLITFLLCLPSLPAQKEK